MNGSGEGASRPKARQSIGHLPTSSTDSSNVDRQNATVNISSFARDEVAKASTLKKKARGKSLGPGGLEALQEISGNALKNNPIFQIKSILKPTVPLTPPKNIPSFDELRKRSTSKVKSPSKNAAEDLLIDFSTPGPSRDSNSITKMSGSEILADPFSPVKLDDNKDKQQSDNEDEKNRQAAKKEILERRAARRKSLANRRVSFAPEATLHTWSVMELVEDSTTSSAANSTRRQSTITSQQSPAVNPTSDVVEPPSTPPEQEDIQVRASPAHQREQHQKKRRRSSADVDVSGDDVFSSSPSGDVMTESSPIRVEESIHSDSDSDGDTAMDMDGMTQQTVRSQDSGTEDSLEERLRAAANHAGTRGIDYDENGEDISMEMVDDTVTNAFQPWARKQQQQKSSTDAMQDQENVNPFSPAQNDPTQDMTMEVTRAMGGILEQNSPSKSRRKSTTSSRRRSSVARRQSAGEDSIYGDESMDLTTVAGGILGRSTADDEDEDDQEMTMEFTTAVGGMRGHRESIQSTVSDDNSMDMTVAVGGILGTIDEQTEPQTDLEDDDKTVAMEMTKAVGQILTKSQARQLMQEEMDSTTHTSASHNTTPHKSTSLETTPLRRNSTPVKTTPRQMGSVVSAVSETGSPSFELKPRSSSRPASTRTSRNVTPKSASKSVTPKKSITPRKSTTPKDQQQTTPTKQLTPLPTRAETPQRTPVAINITQRSTSPKKLFQAEIKARSSPVSTRKSPRMRHDPIFAKDEHTGHQTPRVVLHAPKPHQHLRRQSSGIGLDKEGVGSPRVSELLSRRSSIGDVVPDFKLDVAPTSRLRFEDPQQIEREIDAERAEEHRRESGRFVMEQEADGTFEESNTLQLKDMIESMTPKKNNNSIKVKGRKSLAIGSAKGLLGKRPAELDDDEDEETTPKRLKAVSREGSPVKRIHLPKPPTKEETTGRLTKSEQQALQNANYDMRTPASSQSPEKMKDISTPRHIERFKDVQNYSPMERSASFEDKMDNVVGAVDVAIVYPEVPSPAREEEKISLQQFLNMTNIHFIELSTTKRRHTMAPSSTDQSSSNESDNTESRFVTAATTLPLLELYQHATRELKSYISSGRKIIRSIEAETLAEQPVLFREYVEARPDVKAVMDNQFRNGKTNARLQSKEGWYTWRSQLVDGLRGGLENIKSDMEKDLTILTKQQQDLSNIVPDLLSQEESLEQEFSSLTQRLTEMESVDREALRLSRQQLKSADEEFAQKQALLDQLQQEMDDKVEMLTQADDLKTEMEDQIAEANRVREECRRWPVKDVLTLKTKAESIEQQTGWSLITAEEDADDATDFGVALTLTYQNELRLFFYPSAFQSQTSTDTTTSGLTAPISLVYTGGNDEDDVAVLELSTEYRFFLQLIRSQLHTCSMMPKGTISTRTILDTVSSGWQMARTVSDEIRLLNMTGITRVSIKSDEELAVKLMLMMNNKSRIDVDFVVSVNTGSYGDLSSSISASILPVYGPSTSFLDVSKTRKVTTALNKEIEIMKLGDGAWIQAVRGFDEWHQSQLQAISEHNKVVVPPPASPAPIKVKTPATKRSPLAVKAPKTIQKKALPVPTSRQDKSTVSVQKHQSAQPTTIKEDKTVDNFVGGKENLDPFVFGDGVSTKPAITPQMQEAMMQNTPIKRVGALRRSPI